MTDRLSEVAGGPAAGSLICRVEDIEDGGAKEFSYRSGADLYDIFIQRRGEEIFAYRNLCPHAGTPLNMEEGAFMESGGVYLMCHTHGALFDLESGKCLAGPCNGAFLVSVELEIRNGDILAL